MPWWHDLVGVVWMVAVAVIVLLPALIHGGSLGPYGLLTKYGLLQQHQIAVRSPFAGDLITQMIPWTNLAWTQVHHGLLPLWNPYNALGTPLAFNWQSATFSLPALLGYLAPLRLAYTVQVLTTLVVGGSGIYFFGRVLRLDVVACVFAGTVFELSGSFIGWLGWPVASVMSWTGWIFAATVLVLRGDRRARSVALLSVTMALAVYAGEPDTLVLLASFLALFVVILALMGLPARDRVGGRLRPFGDLAVATVAGLALSAPLLLPGLQLLAGSSRNAGGRVFSGQRALPIGRLLTIMVPGLDGLPIAWHRSYLGVVVAALAVAGWAWYRRRPEVTAVGAVAVVAAVVSFVPFVVTVLYDVPDLGAVRWARSISFLELAVAVLAGVGLDILIRSFRVRGVIRLFGAVFTLAALSVFWIWAAHPREGTIRRENLVWAGAGALLGLAVIGVLAVVRRRSSPTGDSAAFVPRRGRRPALTAGLVAGAVLLAFQAIFLLIAGYSQWSSSAKPFPSTPAETQLTRAVGSDLVGFGTPACKSAPTLGIPANTNIVYGVHQLAAYDPMLPRTYYQAWLSATGRPAGYPVTSRYCPGVTSVAMARRYGVAFVLELHGHRGPKGAIFDQMVGDEDLYRIPGAAQATLTPLLHDGALPTDTAPGRATPVVADNPGSWKLSVAPSTPQVLRLRLTDVPGWHATIDGHPLALEPFSGVMLQATIPSGHHVVILRYWPDTFTAGILLASASALGLVVLLVVSGIRRWRAAGTMSNGP